MVPIQKYASKRDLVAHTLREMILSGQIVPRQRLRQDELSRMLGVSATPIREAIRVLEAEGVLVGEPHHGVSVVEVTADDLQHIGNIRSLLEGLAIRWAVERADPVVYSSTVSCLESSQKQMEACVESGTTEPIANLNRDFHLRLCDLCNSPYLIDIIRRIFLHQPGYIVWENLELAAASVEQHKLILEALRAGNGEAAAHAMHVHIELSALATMK